ncbi:MAG: hypothetical protein GXY83_31965 [Rhodopirellula sp.]|nr:hypothetical protein [Rhodopirellula sp.]
MARSTASVVLLALGSMAALCSQALAPMLQAEESLRDRQTRIEALDPSKKEDLLRRRQLFDDLEPAEQDRLRKLHVQLQESPDGDELAGIMQRYCEWLAGLNSSYERAELLELPPEERVKRIKKLFEEPETARRASGGFPSLERARRPWAEMGPDARRRPTLEDLKAVFEWFGRYLEKESPKLIEAMPEPWREQARRAVASAENSAELRERLTGLWMRWLTENPGKAPKVGEAELMELRGQLSAETRKWLETMPPAEQERTVLGWMRFVAMYHLGSRRFDPALPIVDEKELERFFEKELTGEQRDRLLNLPSDEMRRELRQEYLRWRLKDESPRIPPWSSWRRGHRPGGSPFPGRNGTERQPSPPQR